MGDIRNAHFYLLLVFWWCATEAVHGAVQGCFGGECLRL
jgi:hypothetical protein